MAVEANDMSDPDLVTAMNRLGTDSVFRSNLMANPEGTLRSVGLNLSEVEKQKLAQQMLIESGFTPGNQPGFTADDMEWQRKLARENFEFVMRKRRELGEYTIEILKSTLDRAAATYRTITRMNEVMFFSGILLFISGSICAAIFHDKTYSSLLLAGLGAANFVTVFLVGAIEKTQVALSNLVQVEVAFMTYFDQMAFTENIAQLPAVDPIQQAANLEKASILLQERSSETIALLQTFVGALGSKETRKRKSKNNARVHVDSSESTSS